MAQNYWNLSILSFLISYRSQTSFLHPDRIKPLTFISLAVDFGFQDYESEANCCYRISDCNFQLNSSQSFQDHIDQLHVAVLSPLNFWIFLYSYKPYGGLYLHYSLPIYQLSLYHCCFLPIQLLEYQLFHECD